MSLTKAKEVIQIEIQALKDLAQRLDGSFIKALNLILECEGRVIVSGMGKTGIIGRKIAATLSSTGTPSMWMHSAEALHGDLGQVTKNDVLILISNSGESEEIKRLLPFIKKINAKIIAMTGNIKSTLGKYSDLTLDVSVRQEGCPLGLAPMASTTATLVLGDALAACLLIRRRFKKEDFALFHPAGSLGRKLLLTVGDLMRKGSHFAKVKDTASVKNVLLAITKRRCGSACVVDKKGNFIGIFTDGDLRRHIESDPQLLKRNVKDVMTKHPITVHTEQLAVEALTIFEKKKIDELAVVNGKNNLIGLLDVQDILRAGLV